MKKNDGKKNRADAERTLPFFVDDEPSPFDCKARASRVFDARRYWRDAVSRRGLADVAVERSFATTRSEKARAVGFTGRFVGRPVFAKLFWRNRTGKRAFERQNVEKSLLQRDLEAIVSRGATPCLPFRMMSVSTTVGRFRKTRANRVIDTRLRGMRIVDASEKSASFRNACLSLLPKDAREDIEDESHRVLLTAARDGRLVHETLDVKKPTLCRGGLVDVVFTEKCADLTLFDYLADASADASASLPEVYLMLVHALSVFARRGISHNDLHSRNVVLRRVPPTVVSFGSARRFVTTVAPFVVDWDLGRSETVNNPELEDYGFVGLADQANPLFDLYGLVKTFLYHHDAFSGRSSFDETVATSRQAARVADTFEKLFEPAARRHGWLLEFEYRYLDDSTKRIETQKCVQQTPYIPRRGSGKVEKRWPSSVRELTPRFSTIGDRLYALVARPLRPDEVAPDDAGGREFAFADFFDI